MAIMLQIFGKYYNKYENYDTTQNIDIQYPAELASTIWYIQP